MNPSARAESGIASTKTTIAVQKCIENRRVGIVRCRSCKRDATRHMTRRIFSILVSRSEVSRSRSRRYSSSRPRRLPEQIGSLDFCHKHGQAPGVSLCIENGKRRSVYRSAGRPLGRRFRTTGPRTAWPPRGLCAIAPLCDVDRTRAYHAESATPPSADRHPRRRTRTRRAGASPWPWLRGRRQR